MHRKIRLKRGSSQLKRSPLRRISAKKAAQIEQEEKEQEKMWEFFLDIWNSTPPSERKCYETGRPLVGVPLSVYFHHVLPKHLYPEYKYCKWNVVLLTWLVHDQAENDIDRTPKVKARKEELLQKHQNGELVL